MEGTISGGCEKFPSIGLEAVVDNNLWFWHAAFCFSETLKNISIWEHSSLYESMINGDTMNRTLIFQLTVKYSTIYFTLSMAFTLN
jgi:hypothetical protein